MKKYLILLLLIFTLSRSNAQDVKVIQIAELISIMESPSDTTLILNFWASWCAPCIKELPIFENVGQEYTKQKVKVIFVNLDKLDKLDSKVEPILKKNLITAETFLLNETDENFWIDVVDPNWQGSLPYTIILSNKKNQKVSIENAVTKQELEKKLYPFLN